MDHEGKICLVCSSPNNALHFGLEVCRACSSFFRRVKLSGRGYPCRQVDRKCDVTRNGKLSCRRCRYDKCVAVGMVYDEPLRRNKKASDEEENIDEPSKSKELTFLDRIGREYEISVVNREHRELAMLRTCADARRLPHPSQEIYTGTAILVQRVLPITFEETWSLFCKSYPSLGDLPSHVQMDLYRSYLPHFTIIDSFIRAWKVWGTFDKYSMCSVSICVDLRTPDKWFEPSEGGANRDALVDSMALCISDQKKLLVPSLIKAQLTGQEMNALFALMLSETDLKTDASKQLHTLMDSIRNDTLHDLQRYYREELGLSDFSARLGNLMTICHAVKECSLIFHGVFRMQVTLFDIWSTQTLMKEILLY